MSILPDPAVLLWAVPTVMGMVVVAKKAWPQMAGATTVFLAGVLSLVIAGLETGAHPPFTCFAIEKGLVLFAALWGGACGVAWGVRNPSRPNGSGKPPE